MKKRECVILVQQQQRRLTLAAVMLTTSRNRRKIAQIESLRTYHNLTDIATKHRHETSPRNIATKHRHETSPRTKEHQALAYKGLTPTYQLQSQILCQDLEKRNLPVAGKIQFLERREVRLKKTSTPILARSHPSLAQEWLEGR